MNGRVSKRLRRKAYEQTNGGRNGDPRKRKQELKKIYKKHKGEI